MVGKILRGARFAVLALVLLYAGDDISARFRLPNGRQTLGSVDVQVMWAIKQKNGRIDYELGDRETRPCLYSLFPHLGYTPCWYLTRHKNQVIEVGNVRVNDKQKHVPRRENPVYWIVSVLTLITP